MVSYIFVVAILNLGFGFALAVYLARRYQTVLAERGFVESDISRTDVADALADMGTYVSDGMAPEATPSGELDASPSGEPGAHQEEQANEDEGADPPESPGEGSSTDAEINRLLDSLPEW